MAIPGAIIPVKIDTSSIPKEFQRAISRAEASIKPIRLKIDSSPLGRITGDLKEFDKSLAASNARVISFGLTTSVIYGVSKAFSSLVRETIEVEKRLIEINSILNASSKNFTQFTKGLFDVGAQTGKTFTDVADAASEFARQGLSAQETLQRTKDAMVLSRLAMVDSKKAVNDLTASVNTFKHEALDTTTVVEKMATVDAAFAVSSKDLAEALSRAGATAADAKLSFDQLLASVTSVQQTTARGGAVIGNAFKSIFTRVERPQTLQILEKYGIATKTIEGNTRPVIDILEDLAKQFKNLGDAERSYVAGAVAGAQQINILRSLLSDLGRENSIYRSALSISENATNEATKRNEELNRSLSALANQSVLTAQKMAYAFGERTIEPGLKSLLSNFNLLADGLQKAGETEWGKRIGEGIMDGIGSAIKGPGAIVLFGVLGSIVKRVVVDSAKAIAHIGGVNNKIQEQATIQTNINNILANGNSEYLRRLALAKSTQEQERILLEIIKAETSAIRARNASLSAATSGLMGRGIRGTDSGGFRVPSFAANDGLREAINRESKKVGRNNVYVDSDTRVISPNNPLGLLVANKLDEPNGGYQGVNRAITEGRDPKKYNIPNFAAPPRDLKRSPLFRKMSSFSFSGMSYILQNVIDKALMSVDLRDLDLNKSKDVVQKNFSNVFKGLIGASHLSNAELERSPQGVKFQKSIKEAFSRLYTLRGGEIDQVINARKTVAPPDAFRKNNIIREMGQTSFEGMSYVNQNSLIKTMRNLDVSQIDYTKTKEEIQKQFEKAFNDIIGLNSSDLDLQRSPEGLKFIRNRKDILEKMFTMRESDIADISKKQAAVVNRRNIISSIRERNISDSDSRVVSRAQQAIDMGADIDRGTNARLGSALRRQRERELRSVFGDEGFASLQAKDIRRLIEAPVEKAVSDLRKNARTSRLSRDIGDFFNKESEKWFPRSFGTMNRFNRTFNQKEIDSNPELRILRDNYLSQHRANRAQRMQMWGLGASFAAPMITNMAVSGLGVQDTQGGRMALGIGEGVGTGGAIASMMPGKWGMILGGTVTGFMSLNAVLKNLTQTVDQHKEIIDEAARKRQEESNAVALSVQAFYDWREILRNPNSSQFTIQRSSDNLDRTLQQVPNEQLRDRLRGAITSNSPDQLENIAHEIANSSFMRNTAETVTNNIKRNINQLGDGVLMANRETVNASFNGGGGIMGLPIRATYGLSSLFGADRLGVDSKGMEELTKSMKGLVFDVTKYTREDLDRIRNSGGSGADSFRRLLNVTGNAESSGELVKTLEKNIGPEFLNQLLLSSIEDAEKRLKDNETKKASEEFGTNVAKFYKVSEKILMDVAFQFEMASRGRQAGITRRMNRVSGLADLYSPGMTQERQARIGYTAEQQSLRMDQMAKQNDVLARTLASVKINDKVGSDPKSLETINKLIQRIATNPAELFTEAKEIRDIVSDVSGKNDANPEEILESVKEGAREYARVNQEAIEAKKRSDDDFLIRLAKIYRERMSNFMGGDFTQLLNADLSVANKGFSAIRNTNRKGPSSRRDGDITLLGDFLNQNQLLDDRGRGFFSGVAKRGAESSMNKVLDRLIKQAQRSGDKNLVAMLESQRGNISEAAKVQAENRFQNISGKDIEKEQLGIKQLLDREYETLAPMQANTKALLESTDSIKDLNAYLKSIEDSRDKMKEEPKTSLARGFIPNFNGIQNELRDIRKGVGGALPSDRPMVRNLTGMGNVVVNSGEKIARNFMNSGKDAVLTRDMMNMARGFVPNFRNNFGFMSEERKRELDAKRANRRKISRGAWGKVKGFGKNVAKTLKPSFRALGRASLIDQGLSLLGDTLLEDGSIGRGMVDVGGSMASLIASPQYYALETIMRGSANLGTLDNLNFNTKGDAGMFSFLSGVDALTGGAVERFGGTSIVNVYRDKINSQNEIRDFDNRILNEHRKRKWGQPQPSQNPIINSSQSAVSSTPTQTRESQMEAYAKSRGFRSFAQYDKWKNTGELDYSGSISDKGFDYVQPSSIITDFSNEKGVAGQIGVGRGGKGIFMKDGDVNTPDFVQMAPGQTSNRSYKEILKTGPKSQAEINTLQSASVRVWKERQNKEWRHKQQTERNIYNNKQKQQQKDYVKKLLGFDPDVDQNFAAGFIPNFVGDAVEREVTALRKRGMSDSMARKNIFIGSRPEIGGVGVGNFFDEPAGRSNPNLGILQGITREIRRGNNPRHSGTIPNFADNSSELISAIRALIEALNSSQNNQQQGNADGSVSVDHSINASVSVAVNGTIEGANQGVNEYIQSALSALKADLESKLQQLQNTGRYTKTPTVANPSPSSPLIT